MPEETRQLSSRARSQDASAIYASRMASLAAADLGWGDSFCEVCGAPATAVVQRTYYCEACFSEAVKVA